MFGVHCINLQNFNVKSRYARQCEPSGLLLKIYASRKTLPVAHSCLSATATAKQQVCAVSVVADRAIADSIRRVIRGPRSVSVVTLEANVHPTTLRPHEPVHYWGRRQKVYALNGRLQKEHQFDCSIGFIVAMHNKEAFILYANDLKRSFLKTFRQY